LKAQGRTFASLRAGDETEEAAMPRAQRSAGGCTVDRKFAPAILCSALGRPDA
jgi:hypothetical protein